MYMKWSKWTQRKIKFFNIYRFREHLKESPASTFLAKQHYLFTTLHLVFYYCVLVAQSCLTLCNPMDCRPPGPSVHGISQARILEWVAIHFSRGSSWPRDQTQVSRLSNWAHTLRAHTHTHTHTHKSTYIIYNTYMCVCSYINMYVVV